MVEARATDDGVVCTASAVFTGEAGGVFSLIDVFFGDGGAGGVCASFGTFFGETGSEKGCCTP